MLYTIIVDYRDITNTSQINASTPSDAFIAWRNNQIAKNELGISKNEMIKFKNEFDEDLHTPIQINNLSKVWCADLPFLSNYMSIIIVETVSNA